MLGESLQYLGNYIFCPRYVNKLGILHEIIAIKSRYYRHREAWDEHLERTKAYILKTAEKTRIKNHVLILGAGLLLDIPLNELSNIFKKVTLVDIFFLQESIDRIKSFENVDFKQLDITSSFKEFYTLFFKYFRNNPQYFDQHLKNLSYLLPNFALDFTDLDLVISANLCSQLPSTIEGFLNKKKYAFENKAFYCQSLVKNHLQYLRQLRKQTKAEVLLISDFERIIKNKSGEIIFQTSSLADAVPELTLNHDEDWVWQLAPYGELDKNHSLELKVLAKNID